MIQQGCEQCKKLFASYYCDLCRLLCGIGPDAKPNYHCNGCQMCMVGLRENSRHCPKCNCCFSIEMFDKHNCVPEKTECMVCLGDLSKTIFGRVVLNCKH